MDNVRLCDKKLCVFTSTKERRGAMAGGGPQVITCPSSSWAHPRGHQPIQGPSAQAQQSTESQRYGEIQITDSEKVTPCPRLLPGLSWQTLSPVVQGLIPILGSPQQQLSGASFGLSRVTIHIVGIKFKL